MTDEQIVKGLHCWAGKIVKDEECAECAFGEDCSLGEIVDAAENRINELAAENAALRERLEKTEHRAEVAEKALKIVAYEIPCDDWCPFSQKCNVELNGENWYQCCFDEYLRQAEEKLTEEGKDD